MDNPPFLKKRKLVVFLVVALLLSNIIWAANYYGQYIGCGYQQSALMAHKELLKQLEAVLPVVAKGNATREEVVAATHLNGPRRITYETQDSVVIGDVSLQFDNNGHLAKVSVAPPIDIKPVQVAPLTAAPPQSLSYVIYSISPFGSLTMIANGTRVYTPAEVLVTPDHMPVVRTWTKKLSIAEGFSIGAQVNREAKIEGFGLWLENERYGFSWEWFDLEENNIYRKRQGSGRVKVNKSIVDNEEQISTIEFLDDVTLRLEVDSWRSMIPFINKITHQMVIKKGSVLWLD